MVKALFARLENIARALLNIDNQLCILNKKITRLNNNIIKKETRPLFYIESAEKAASVKRKDPETFDYVLEIIRLFED